MFTWSAVHVMNECVYTLCILEDENNIPKENVPPPLPLPYPKIYPIIVPGIISCSDTSHFIIVFVDEVYV